MVLCWLCMCVLGKTREPLAPFGLDWDSGAFTVSVPVEGHVLLVYA